MNYDQYIHEIKPNADAKEWPRILRFAASSKQLVMIGVQHYVGQPDHPQYDQIMQEFVAFKPDVVFWEGTGDRGLENSSTETEARALGESSYALYLVRQAKIADRHLEPTAKDTAAYLAEKFSQELAFTYLVMRPIHTWVRHPVLFTQAETEQKLADNIAEFQAHSNWPDIDYSLAGLQKHFQQFTGADLHLDLKTWSWETLSLNYSHSPLNEAARVSVLFRDIFMVRLFQQTLEKYSRLFVVIGGAHTYTQEPALQKMFEDLAK